MPALSVVKHSHIHRTTMNANRTAPILVLCHWSRVQNRPCGTFQCHKQGLAALLTQCLSFDSTRLHAHLHSLLGHQGECPCMPHSVGWPFIMTVICVRLILLGLRCGEEQSYLQVLCAITAASAVHIVAAYLSQGRL